MSLKDDLARLKQGFVDTSCRCPKPCMRHSRHYREEALRDVNGENCMSRSKKRCKLPKLPRVPVPKPTRPHKTLKDLKERVARLERRVDMVVDWDGDE